MIVMSTVLAALVLLVNVQAGAIYPRQWTPGAYNASLAPCETEQISRNLSSYAPSRGKCPKTTQWVRNALGISEQEASWVRGRKLQMLPALTEYLGRLNLTGFDQAAYMQAILQNPQLAPTIAFAISGGGSSSALTGTGALRAFDARFAPALEQRTGGILQIMTYFAGISGGSWPVMSLATSNYPEIDAMISSWILSVSLYSATKTTQHRATIETVFEQIYEKYAAGFDVSFADYLGRNLGYGYTAGPEGGISTTLSGVTNLSAFQNYEMPFPIWQNAQTDSADPLQDGIRAPLHSNTQFEYSPYEFGSWDGPKAFFPMEYLGTPMSNGEPKGECVVGFDNAGYLLALMGNGWGFWLLDDISNGTLGSFSKRSLSRLPQVQKLQNTKTPRSMNRAMQLKTRPHSKRQSSGNEAFPISLIEELEEVYNKTFHNTLADDLYSTIPNPFAASPIPTNGTFSNGATIQLTDNSIDGQGLPFWNLAQPARQVDLIMAWDDVTDAKPYLWSNGTDMYNSYIYAVNHSIPYPIVPPYQTFVNRNLTNKPVLFGCDANMTTTNDLQAPIIMFMGNAPYSSFTNFSGFQQSFSNEQVGAIMVNGFNYITQGNGTLDAEWPECLGCAAIDRSLSRIGLARTAQCQSCMSRYCWDGVEDNSPGGIVDLPLLLAPNVSYAKWNSSQPYWPILGGQ